MLEIRVSRNLWLLVSLLPYLRLGSADCYAAQIPVSAGQYNFFFEAGYQPPPNCPAANITISRLYVQGACVGSRDTDFGNNPPDCSNNGGTVTSSTSCADIYAHGPSSAFVQLANVRSGDWFDYGNVCTNSQQGFYYIQSSCTNLTSRPMTFAMDPFSANWCSRKVSRGAAVGIAIAFFLLLFVFIIAIYYFVRRRQLNQVQRPAAPNIGMQPYPQAPPPPYPQASPPPYPGGPSSQMPSSSTGFVQPPFTPFDNKPVTGIPVPNYQQPRF